MAASAYLISQVSLLLCFLSLLLITGLVSSDAGHQAPPPQKLSVLVQNTGGSDMHSLLRRIFTHYDKEVMPTRPVLVHLDVLLLRVKSTVEKEGIFESVIALFIDWHDRRMMWNPLHFDNISLLAFDSEKVWLPDIALTNSADHLYSISRDFRFVVRVTNDGILKFVPTGTARTWCALRLLTFPFDLQTCSLEFESWSLEAETLQFDSNGHLVVDPSFGSNQWHLCHYTSNIYNHTYDFTGETFARIRFDFTVRRKSTFYMLNIVFPCATLSMIQLLVFVIPSCDTTSDRIGFGTTNLLTLVVFQTIATEEMPKTSDAVTSLSKYIIALIILASFGICESVIVERMFRIVNLPPPNYIIQISRLVPVLWREKQSVHPSACTDEILTKHLASMRSGGGKGGRGKDVAGGQPHSNFSSNYSIKRKKYAHEEEPKGTSSYVPLTSYSAAVNSSSKASFSHLLFRGNSRCWLGTSDSISEGQMSPANLSPPASPIWHKYRRKNNDSGRFTMTGAHSAAYINQSDMDDSNIPIKRAATTLTSNGIRSNSYHGNSKKSVSNNNLRSPTKFNYSSEMSPIDNEAFETDDFGDDIDGEQTRLPSHMTHHSGRNRSHQHDDLPETRTEVEVTIARPSILTKPSSQRRLAYVTRRLQQQRNAMLWAEVITRLDIASFSICTLLAFFIPVILFIPLFATTECPADAEPPQHDEVH